MENEIIPVILGADLNCYNVARAFYECYGATSYVFGKAELGPIKYSRIIKFTKIPSNSSDGEILQILTDFASKKPAKPYIIGCTDGYALFIIENKEFLSEYFTVRAPDESALRFADKTEFYKECEHLSLPYPEYVIAEKDKSLPCFDFKYPVVVKPSSSSEYWKHPFPDMRKVYFAENADKASDIVNKIYLSGYGGKVLVQNMISGNKQYVLTVYSKAGNVIAACVGEVLLGEVTPKGLGNHVAIITRKIPEITDMAKEILRDINYSGFANFDIMCDVSTGKFYLLEMNLRQGRSNYYMTAAGMSIAKLIVEGSPISSYKEIFWRCVPRRIVKKRVSLSLRRTIDALRFDDREFSSFDFAKDLKNPFRALYVLIHNVRFFSKYKNE